MRSKYTPAQKETVVRLRKLGWKYSDISDQTGVKINTIKTLLKNERESNQTINGADVEEKIEVFSKDNNKIIDSKSLRITTLEQLIEYCEINLSIWVIDKHVINKWEVGGKFGIKGDEYFELQDLFQVKAWLSKIEPEAISPVISPININIGKLRQINKKEVEYKKGLLLFDPQIGFEQNMRSKKLTPFHDRKAMDIVFQFCTENNFDTIHLGGDWQDNAMWSDKFLRKPAYYLLLNQPFAKTLGPAE